MSSDSSDASTIIPMDVSSDYSFQYQDGMIVRMMLKNFVTYTFVEFKAKPKMNMIVGPNGSGKSTVLCAIVLGLGGKPSIIGRSSNVADYVKRDTKQAVIEIELFCMNGQNKIIKRIIDDSQRTEWYLHNKKVAFNKIKEVIDSFNIDIENLCQLLPQDRVHDFAKMTKPQLLDATQTCAGDKRLSVWFNDLKTFKTNSVNARRMYENLNRKVEIETGKLISIQEAVRQYREQEKFLDDINTMKKKVFWTEFEELDKLKKQAHEKFLTVRAEYNQDFQAANPLADAIAAKLQDIKAIELEIKKKASDIDKIKLEEKTYNKQYIALFDEINVKKQEINDQILSSQCREDDIKTFIQQIQNIENSLPRMTEKDILLEIKDVDQKLTDMLRKKNDLRSIETSLEQNFSILNQKYLAMESRAKHIFNKQDGKKKLLADNLNLKSAYDWLSSNQHLFNKKIYGPVFMEIDVKDETKAKYVEQCISYQDLMAFVCEDKEDLGKFFNMVNDQLNLRVNVVHSSSPVKDVSDMFYPNLPLSELSQYGFTNFVLDFIDAPPPIMKLLCSKYFVHSIPVGPASAAHNLPKVPTKISTFFYGDQVSRVKRSKYSKEHLNQINSIGSPRFLVFSIDKELLKTTEAELKVVKESLISSKEALDAKRQDFQEIEVQINQLKNQRRNLNSSIEHIKVSHSRLNMKKKELQSLRESNIDVGAKKAECHKLACINIKKGIEILDKINQVNKKLLDVETELECKNIFCETVIKQMMELKKRQASVERSIRDMLKKVNIAKLEYEKVASKAIGLLDKAQRSTDGLMPGDDVFDHRYGRKFASLPNDLNELNNAIMLAESELSDQTLLSPGILDENEKQEKLIHSLKNELEQLNITVGSENERLSALKNKWTSKFNALVKEINDKFSSYLKFLRCAGSVELDKGQNEDDFDNYGLCIRVKFRKEGTLQELNAHVQSGGERSMTTAIFLLALQNIIKVPFRIVDEINQGMDAFNERRVYFLIMSAVSKDPNAQYILITPKLLEDTKISMDTTFHNIYAGDVGLIPNLDENHSDSEPDDDVHDVSWSIESYV